jgi:hypothetical protein
MILWQFQAFLSVSHFWRRIKPDLWNKTQSFVSKYCVFGVNPILFASNTEYLR